jgi:hypothetical protein
MSGDTSHALRSAASAAAVTGMRTRLGHLSSGDLLGLRFALAGLFAWGRRGRGVFFYSLFLGLRASKFSSTYSRVIFAELLGPLGSESHTLVSVIDEFQTSMFDVVCDARFVDPEVDFPLSSVSC